MRRSPDYYPEHVNLYCSVCDQDYPDVPVTDIDADDVRVECPNCGEPTYVQVIY